MKKITLSILANGGAIALASLLLSGCADTNPHPRQQTRANSPYPFSDPTNSRMGTREDEVVINIGEVDEEGKIIGSGENELEASDGEINISMGMSNVDEDDDGYGGSDSIDMGNLSNTTIPSSSVSTKKRRKVKRIAFPSKEYRKIKSLGKGTVSGSVFVKTSKSKKPKARIRLYLNPVTSYSKQWYREAYLQNLPMKSADKRIFKYLKFTTSSSRGKFNFYGVPNGDYYIVANISCGKECGYKKTHWFKVAKQISVVDGENTILDVDLSLRVK